MVRKCLNEIARVGYMEHNQYEIYIHTDDQGIIPHFHVRDASTMGSQFETCVKLDTNEYFLHGKYKNKLNHKDEKMLYDFMKQPCRSPKYKNNYEFAVEMWNLNNASSYVQVKEDENGNVIIPNYAMMQ